MKRAVLAVLALALLAAPATVVAQGVEVTAFGGYRFGGTVKTDEGNLVLEASPSFGVTVGIPVTREGSIELFYSRQNADLTVDQEDGGDVPEIPQVAVEYWHLGYLYDFQPPGGIRPYLVARLGASRFDPIVVDAEDVWRFSGGLGVGARVFFTDNIGARVEAQVLSTAVQEGDYFCREGHCFPVVTSGVHQGSISAGLVVAF